MAARPAHEISSAGSRNSGPRAPTVHGVPLKAVRYLTDMALELAGDVAASEDVLDEGMAITAETLTAAAEMVSGLLQRAEGRRLSCGT